MKTGLKIIGTVVVANLLSNVGFKLIMTSSGSAATLGRKVIGVAAEAAELAATPAPIMTLKMVDRAGAEEIHVQEDLNVA